MAGITLEKAETQLAAYLAAEAAVLTGQSYRLNVGGTEREVRKADLAAIQQGIEIWDARVKRFERGGISVRRAGCLD